jgi:predicted nucleotidyltransferase
LRPIDTGIDIDIRPAQLRIVREILARHAPDREVRAFGSRVTGCAKTYSDLDLAIMGEVPLSLAAEADLRESFSESGLPFRVDVVIWASTAEYFRQIIGQHNVVVQRGGGVSRVTEESANGG